LHYEVIIEARNEIANDVAAIFKTCMEATFRKLIPNVLFEVKPEVKRFLGLILTKLQ
jgi:hypothetical protein